MSWDLGLGDSQLLLDGSRSCMLWSKTQYGLEYRVDVKSKDVGIFYFTNTSLMSYLVGLGGLTPSSSLA